MVGVYLIDEASFTSVNYGKRRCLAGPKHQNVFRSIAGFNIFQICFAPKKQAGFNYYMEQIVMFTASLAADIAQR